MYAYWDCQSSWDIFAQRFGECDQGKWKLAHYTKTKSKILEYKKTCNSADADAARAWSGNAETFKKHFYYVHNKKQIVMQKDEQIAQHWRCVVSPRGEAVVRFWDRYASKI